MTTHLVIADQDTLTRILLLSTGITVADYPLPWRPTVADVEAWRHVKTGDRWLFRTPEDAVPPMENVGFIFGLDFGVANSLPLIAAADLLGVGAL